MKPNSIRNNENQAIALPVPWISFPYPYKVMVAFALLMTLLTRSAHTQCVAPTLTFNSPVLISRYG